MRGRAASTRGPARNSRRQASLRHRLARAPSQAARCSDGRGGNRSLREGTTIAWVAETTSEWITSDERPAVDDFWAVYDANFVAVLGGLIRVAPERRDVMVAGARERLR